MADEGRCVLGDVLFTVALWIEPEQISLDAANKVEYVSDDKTALQRVEFTSRRHKGDDRVVS